MYAKSFITFINASVLKMVMPKKKKVKAVKPKLRKSKAVSPRKTAGKHQEAPAIVPIATRELPPQPVQESVPEIKEETPVEEPEKVEEQKEVEEVEEPEEPESSESHKQIIIGDAMEFGWNSVKSHFWFFVGIFFLFSALSFMTSGARAIGTRVVLGLFLSGISLGYIKLTVDVVDGKAPEFKELFSCFALLLKYLVAAVLYSVVVAVGLVLFVIPGIIWAVQFGFYPFVIVKERLGPLAALRKSSALTAGVKGKLIVFSFALLGVNLLGVIALGIGIIITIPLSIIAAAHVFHQLEKQTHS